jgi:hypothetical protein
MTTGIVILRNKLMNGLRHTAFIILFAMTLLGAIVQLDIALKQADMDRFFLWTRIATSIAAFPTVWCCLLLTMNSLDPTSDRSQ